MNRGMIDRMVRLLSPNWTSNATNLAAGARQRIQFGDLPRQIEGRATYLAGFVIYATLRFDAVAATMPGTMPGYLYFTGLKDFALTSQGHRFLPGDVDGYDLYLDTLIRCGEYPVAIPSALADADATASTQAVQIVCRFDNPAAPASQRDDGLIPVGLFDHIKSGDNVLEFTVGSSFDGFAGVTITSCYDLEAYAILATPEAAGKGVRVPTPWAIRKLGPVLEADVKINPFGPIEYLVMNNRKDDAGTYVRDLDGYEGIRVTVGDSPIIDARSSKHVGRSMDILRLGGNGVSGASVTEGTEEFLPLLVSGIGQYRTKMPRGRIRVEYTHDAGYDAVGARFLWREHGEQVRTLQTAWAELLGVPTRGGEIAVVPKARAAKGDVNLRSGEAGTVLDWRLGGR